MQPLKITVVTVSYNAAATIEETIRSVVDQTYDNVEYIIIDGGSTDGTVDIIRRYAEGGSEAGKHNHVIAKWISEPDRGIYDAMNKGIALATGDYVIFINAGDHLHNKYTMCNVSNLIDGSDVVYGNLILNLAKCRFLAKPEPISDMIYRFPIFHPSCLTKTSLLKQYKYNDKFRICGDYEFYYRIYKEGYNFEYVDFTMTEFDAESGISNTDILSAFKEESTVNKTHGTLSYYKSVILISLKEQIKHLIKKFDVDYPNKRRLKQMLHNPRYKQL